MQLKMTTNANMPYTTCYPLSPPLSIWRGIEMWTFEVSVKLANQMASMAGLFFPGGSDHRDWEFILWAYEGRIYP
jgi:hypothetical protein